MAEPVRTAPRAAPCPICGKPATPAAAPFCSARCADIDLGKWLGGAYQIPAEPDDDEDGPDGLPGSRDTL